MVPCALHLAWGEGAGVLLLHREEAEEGGELHLHQEEVEEGEQPHPLVAVEVQARHQEEPGLHSVLPP